MTHARYRVTYSVLSYAYLDPKEVLIAHFNPADRKGKISVLRALPVGSTVTFKGYPGLTVTRDS